MSNGSAPFSLLNRHLVAVAFKDDCVVLARRPVAVVASPPMANAKALYVAGSGCAKRAAASCT